MRAYVSHSLALKGAVQVALARPNGNKTTHCVDNWAPERELFNDYEQQKSICSGMCDTYKVLRFTHNLCETGERLIISRLYITYKSWHTPFQ